MRQLRQVKVKEFGTVGAQLGVRYEGSPIIVADGTPPSPDSPSVYVPTARPGSRLPHFFLSDGSSLFDKLGLFFTLLDLSKDHSQAEAWLKSGRNRGIKLKHLPIDSRYRTELDATYVLVRPDTHVGWRGDQLPADATSLFNTLLGWNV